MKLNPNKKIRIRSGKTSFFTTVKQIRGGVGDYSAFNIACGMALNALEVLQQDSTVTPRGIVGTWNDLQIQIDVVVE